MGMEHSGWRPAPPGYRDVNRDMYKDEAQQCGSGVEPATQEPVTSQITDRLDVCLKRLEELHSRVRDRADSLLGPQVLNNPADAKCPQQKLDSGMMDRIARQTRDVATAIEYLEQQIWRLNVL